MAQEGKEVSENDCQTKPNGIVLVKFTSNCLIYIYIQNQMIFFFIYFLLQLNHEEYKYTLSSKFTKEAKYESTHLI